MRVITLTALLIVLAIVTSAFGQPSPTFPVNRFNISNFGFNNTVFWLPMNNTAALGQSLGYDNATWANTGVTIASNHNWLTPGRAANFSDTTGEVLSKTMPPTAVYFPEENLTFSFWVNFTDVSPSASTQYMVKNVGTGTSRLYITTISRRLRIGLGNNGDLFGCGDTLNNNTLHHIALTLNSTNLGTGAGTATAYLNGTMCGNATYSGLTDFDSTWRIGLHEGDGIDFNGFMTDFLVFNRTLNGTFINDTLFFGGVSTPSGPSSAVGSNTTFTIVNAVNRSVLTTFNITVRNTTAIIFSHTVVNAQNTSWNLTTNAYNITYVAAGHVSNRIDLITLENNQSHNLTTGQGRYNLTVTTPIRRFNFTNWTATNTFERANTTTNQTQNVTSIQFFYNIGLNNISVTDNNPTGPFYTRTLQVNFSTFGQNLTNISDVWTVFFLFNATNLLTGTGIQNITVRLSNGTYGWSNYTNTTNGTIIIGLENVTLVAEVNATGYFFNNFSITPLSIFHNTTFSLLPTLTLNVTILNEQSLLQILNGSIFTVQVIGASFSANHTIGNGTGTQNSTALFQNVPSGDYELRYSGGGFEERSKYVTLTNVTPSNFELILLDTQNSTTTTFVITDQFGKNLENLTVIALRYYINLGGTNDGFKEVAACKTNFVGECVINLEQPGVFYKFMFQFAGQTLLITEATEIDTDPKTFTFQVNTEQGILSGVTQFGNVQGSVNFTNASTPNFFQYTFSATDGLTHEWCLTVYNQTLRAKTVYNSSCVTGSAGSIVISVPSSNQSSFLGQGIVLLQSGNNFVVDEDFHSYAPSPGIFGAQGIFWASMLIGVLVGAGSGNPAVGVALMVIGIVTSMGFGLIIGGWELIVIFIALGGFVFMKLKT